MKRSPFGSLIVAMVTPFNDGLGLNLGAAESMAHELVENGVDGIVVSGTTGESPTLSVNEKIELLKCVKNAVGTSHMVWGGCGGYNTAEACNLAKKMEKAGADGILAVTPYYNKPTQEGLYLHFKEIARAISLPIMLYNVPSRTGVNLLPETVKRLAEEPNIVAIKEASGNIDQVTAILTLAGDRMYVYSGDDSLTLPMLSVGASGVVSVVGHLISRDLKQMIEMFAAGDVQEAARLHRRMFRLCRAMFVTTNPIPVKTALNILGKNVGGFRLPLCPPSLADYRLIEDALKDYGLV